MQRLAVELRLPDLAPREQEPCALRVDDLVLGFYPDADGGFTLLCPLGEADWDAPETLDALLAGNLFADGVGGHALALDGKGEVWLTQRFDPAVLSFSRFLAHLQRFANAADYWREGLARPTSPRVLH